MTLSSPPGPADAVLLVAPTSCADVPALCDRLRALVQEHGARLVACDVRALVPGALAVEALMRLQLTARRLGVGVRLRGASRELAALIELCGLHEVLPCVRLGGEAGRQPEQREQPLGVEERHELGDLPP